ncbi:NAD-dependent epimerase/dehydratase family protein [Mucilaginibacter sp. BT774]|uniref:NAD-dependent epimerase/dehydratase family protein n=1 Tax=Mucilaginibacter sp. BT774 TaxID=3062276 RepID=UPI0026746214|nr:NAD-dependent epimerase/dehydratase family protein [Mucilaginibacter sp. BT774]MDO3625941.1 NAD-dependent epimerase/dehydratase family protein [Mucilaginibacter sp. BT774]
MKANVLITGSTGFVGQNLLHYLKGDCRVHTINRTELQGVSVEALNSIDTIIHLAGKAHDLKKSSSPGEYYQVNFELTRKLYDAFLKSTAQKFIFISSVKAAADSVTGVLAENDKPNPQTDYGKSKLMAEEYIQNQPLPEGKSYYILRPCMIHGPGNKGNLNLLYKFVKKGIPYPLAGFYNQRSFLSVENLCFVIKELTRQTGIANGVYNVADDETLSTNQVVTLLANAIGAKPKLWKINPKLIGFLAKCGGVLHLPLTTERLQKLTENYIVSNNKLKQALGSVLPLTTIEGLTITAKSFNKA